MALPPQQRIRFRNGQLTVEVMSCYHLRIERLIEQQIEAGLEPFKRLDGPVGLLVSAVQAWHADPIVDKEGNRKTSAPECEVDITAGFGGGFGTAGMDLPTFAVVFCSDLDAAGTGASRHAQYIAKPGSPVTTVVSMRLALPLNHWLGDPDKMARAAYNSFVWVWTRDQQSGRVKAVVQHQPLSTPDGQINLWLSDLVQNPELLQDDKFIRPADGSVFIISLIPPPPPPRQTPSFFPSLALCGFAN